MAKVPIAYVSDDFFHTTVGGKTAQMQFLLNAVENPKELANTRYNINYIGDKIAKAPEPVYFTVSLINNPFLATLANSFDVYALLLPYLKEDKCNFHLTIYLNLIKGFFSNPTYEFVTNFEKLCPLLDAWGVELRYFHADACLIYACTQLYNSPTRTDEFLHLLARCFKILSAPYNGKILHPFCGEYLMAYNSPILNIFIS
jgi:hypothetical protein